MEWAFRLGRGSPDSPAPPEWAYPDHSFAFMWDGPQSAWRMGAKSENGR